MNQTRRTKLHRGDNDVDAELEIEVVTKVSVTLHSRSGRKGSSRQRNPDYNEALLLLLQRMALRNASLEDVLVVSDRAMRQHPRSADRRLPLHFPISLFEVDDLEGVRLKICRSQMTVARSPNVDHPRKGNPTRKIQLVFSLPRGAGSNQSDIVEMIRNG